MGRCCGREIMAVCLLMVCAIGWFAAQGQTAADEKMAIDEYVFLWTVCRTPRTSLRMEKARAGVRVLLVRRPVVTVTAAAKPPGAARGDTLSVERSSRETFEAEVKAQREKVEEQAKRREEQRQVDLYEPSELSPAEGLLYLTPKDAAEIGRTLKRADEFRAKFQNAEKAQRQEFAIGPYTLAFCGSKQLGFWAEIVMKDNEKQGMTLQDAEITELAPQLAKAMQMAALVDQRIRP